MLRILTVLGLALFVGIGICNGNNATNTVTTAAPATQPMMNATMKELDTTSGSQRIFANTVLIQLVIGLAWTLVH